ncbi:MAG TPA: RND family transporter [Desulfobacteraceae bacterium]|nr:RND family transporter [Desulfobacteraceae bacterium]
MPITERLSHNLLGIIITYPRIVLVIVLLCTGILGWQARHFEIDASADTLLLRDDPHYIQTQVVNQRFSPQEFLLIAYKPVNRPLLSEKTFTDLRDLSKKLRRLERVESVRSILNVPLFTQIEGGIDSMQDVSQWTVENQGYSIEQIRESFRGHPLYEDLLINRQQTATALQVLFRSDEELEKINRRIVALQKKILYTKLSADEEQELSQLRQQAEPMEKRLDKIRIEEIETIRHTLSEYEGNAEIYLGGIHVLGYQLIRIIKNDLIVFGGTIAAVICLLLFLIFKKARWVIIPVVCCGCSVLATVGLFGMLGFKTTVISSNFIVLQLILTLAIVIHLIVQYREYSAGHPHWHQTELVKKTLFKKAGPCFYAGITTSVGFASLLFSNIQPVITFGWVMTIAMFFSIVTSLILFPAVMVLFARETKARPWRFSHLILNFFTGLTLKQPLLVAAAGAGVLALSIAGILLLDVENSFINYFRERTRVHQELTFIDRHLGGSTPLDIVYTIPAAAQKKDLVMTADTVQLLQRIQHALKQHQAVGKTLSVVNFTELARQINDNKPLTEYELTAVYWTMEDALREDLLGSFFAPDNAQVRFSIRIKDTTEGLDRAELLEKIRGDMQTLGIHEEQYRLTSLFVLYQDILQRLFHSQILTLGIVFAVLTLTILAIFRSVKIALIGIIPNILSTLSVLGLMGWLGIQLDLMTITIAAIAMGIAVDDTIHYIHRYLEELNSSSAAQAVERSHASVGYALLYTSLIITLGFSLLSFSDFIPSVLFGLLTGFAMIVALLLDLCLLPVLLNRFIRSR